jgi:hypothetical protein
LLISFRFPHQYPACISSLPQTCHTTYPSPHPFQFAPLITFNEQ